jgi:hypothetical protein
LSKIIPVTLLTQYYDIWDNHILHYNCINKMDGIRTLTERHNFQDQYVENII